MSSLTNEELKQMVGDMIKLSALLKTKQAEVKKIRDTYAAISSKVKEYSKQQQLKFIDLDGHQVHVYNHTREPPLNEAYINDRLGEFFSEHKCGSAVTAASAAAYIIKKKKDKIGGTDTWSITLRNIKPKPRKTTTAANSECLVEDEDPSVLRTTQHTAKKQRVHEDEVDESDPPPAQARVVL